MKRSLQAGLLVLCGLGLLHVSLVTDLCLRYVKEGMRLPLIASGAVLLLLGLAAAFLDREDPAERDRSHGDRSHGEPSHDDRPHGDRPHGEPPHDDRPHDDRPHGEPPHDDRPHGEPPHDDRPYGEPPHGERPNGEPPHGEGAVHAHGSHDHSAVPRVSWLLLLPALSLLFYAPPALGAYTASRQPAKVVDHDGGFGPLPRTSPLPMTLSDFTGRVRQDRGQAIRGRVIRLTGFVTPLKGSGGSWDLTRIILNCCAADAQSVKVRIHGGPALPADTWVTVTGTWHPGGRLGTGSATVALDARTVTEVPRPVNGYQDSLPLG
ncbi:TIGR03943 family protein [Streptomyces sp. NPDC013455]|uniref:TIGR03943 family putative permease subunit n=1 Tax=Streptomyces sp. NPDC013455 TaxID=3155605 RepID=UPI0033F506C1